MRPGPIFAVGKWGEPTKKIKPLLLLVVMARVMVNDLV